MAPPRNPPVLTGRGAVDGSSQQCTARYLQRKNYVPLGGRSAAHFLFCVCRPSPYCCTRLTKLLLIAPHLLTAVCRGGPGTPTCRLCRRRSSTTTTRTTSTSLQSAPSWVRAPLRVVVSSRVVVLCVCAYILRLLMHARAVRPFHGQSRSTPRPTSCTLPQPPYRECNSTDTRAWEARRKGVDGAPHPDPSMNVT